jgi:GAF domain-containing protein
MRRRSNRASESTTKRAGKAVKPTRPNALKGTRTLSRSMAGQKTIIARLTRERDEALEQQTATSAMLRIISSSRGELEPVFKAILQNALRICDAEFGTLQRFDGTVFHYAAHVGSSQKLTDFYDRRGPFLPKRGTQLDRMMRTKQVVRTADEAAESVPGPAAELGGGRSSIRVPMLKDNELIGGITIWRNEVRPFADKQIEVMKNFATQAVIAVENGRLLSELRESLQQQTATSEILGVISSSAGELDPVFRTILATATRLCDASFGVLFRFDGKRFNFAADVGTSVEFANFLRDRGPFQPRPGGQLDRVVRNREVSHTADVAAEGVPNDAAILGGARTYVGVPMLKDQELVGIISIYRQEVRPFTDKQIALVQNFAAQAVIAIDNARLLNELRQRTADLTESLEQQTATSEVLKAISSSPGDVKLVFDAVLQNAVRLCEAQFGLLQRFDGGMFHPAAMHKLPEALEKFLTERGAFQPVGTALEKMWRTKQLVHSPDLTKEKVPPPATIYGEARSYIAVPMLKDNELIGSIGIWRQEVRPFTDKQIALLQNFAAQAVIAIENTRLLSELRESLEQQTATADVLRVISSSPGELEPVFHAMLEKAVRVCDAKFGLMYRYDGDSFEPAGWIGIPRALIDFLRQRGAFQPPPGTGLDIMLRTRAVVRTTDDLAERNPGAPGRYGGARSTIIVPMFKDKELIGVIGIYRQEVRPFSDKQTELISNFAAQAVIAIENTRLLSELRESLQQQTATADVLRVVSSSPGDVEPVFESMLENAVRLCDAKFGIIYRWDGALHLVSTHNAPPEFVAARSRPWRPSPDIPMGRMIATKRVAHVVDMAAERGYADQNPTLVQSVEIGGTRSYLAVPMLKDGDLIGAIGIFRQEVRPFTDKQIALVGNFADQAVIAIENTRLLNELRERTDDLTESLEQQTATAEVLRVISSSPGDLAPVFQAMLENATRICDAKFGNIYRWDGKSLHLVGSYNTPTALIAARRRDPPNPPACTPLGDMITTKKTVHGDLSTTRAYAERHPSVVGAVELGGVRTEVAVPLLKNNELIGAFVIYRQEVRPFTDKQIELVTNFAAQAVIAIDNARLLNELRQRTDDLSKSLEDLRTAQDRLVQTQKLASLGQLTAGIAHEIKNPLNFVNNFSGLSVELLDELQEAVASGTFDDRRRSEIAELTDTLRGNLDKIAQHGKRADSIVKNMLLHSREGSGERRSVNINALVEESLNLAYHGARAEKQGFTITLERSFDPEAGEADVFPQEITRVLLNLISNGFYAASKRQGEADSNGYEPVLTASTRSLGDRVEIRIRDNGTGIPPEVKEKMFNPFFTTKPAGEGTGLGLSLSHDIVVKQHSGSIEVDTVPGAFTEFRIILPRTAG